MKIARNVPVSGRSDEWYAPPPGSLSEGAVSPNGLTEGVSSDGSSGPTIYTPAHINSEIFERLRSSGYTPSASLRSAAPSEREPGGLYHPTGYSLNRGVTGDFHRPYATQKILVFTIHRGTLPQSRPLGVPAPSGREPGTVAGGAFHTTGYLRNRGGAGDFHRPYEDSETVSFYHSTGDTPSVTPLRACQLPQRGSREGCVPFNRVLAKIPGCGRFSSPLRGLRRFYLLPCNGKSRT